MTNTTKIIIALIVIVALYFILRPKAATKPPVNGATGLNNQTNGSNTSSGWGAAIDSLAKLGEEFFNTRSNSSQSNTYTQIAPIDSYGCDANGLDANGFACLS